MGLDGDHLLKRLRPVAPPTASAPVRGGAFAGLDGSFARLIRLAETDQLDSQRPIASSSTEELSEDQLRKIGRACDSLEGAGLDDGLVLLGGRAFVVDVEGRSIRQELGDPDLGVVQSLGGVVFVEGMADSVEDGAGGPGMGMPVPPLSANTAFHPDLVAARVAEGGLPPAP
ncbi:MAG: hypothetical protein VX641_02435 [Planctomycetota bacterium]|nr:hypothetical protein [Planctomycetota bacterium]